MLPGDVSYVPGARTAVAGDQCLALVEASADSPAVGRIWQRLSQGAATDELLSSLVAEGLGGTPGFTLLAAAGDGRLRLFCRGAVGATVISGPAQAGPVQAGPVQAGPVQAGAVQAGAVQAGAVQAGPAADDGATRSLRIDGTGLLTWREHVVPEEAERIFLGEPPSDAELRLPAAVGVLLAGCVIIDLTNLAARDTVPYLAVRPAPAAGPVAAGPDVVLADTVADPRGAGQPSGKQKAIVFFPDTITITHPGSVAGSPRPTVADAAPTGGWQDGWQGGGQGSRQGGLIDVPPWLAGPGAQAEAAGLPQRESGPGEPGHTVKRADLADVVARTTPPDRIGPVVPALICPSGHVNPPSGGACRRCGARLPHDAVLVPRPVLGVLRLSLGDVIALDRGVVMGRSPRTDFTGPDGEERPHVVKLPSADGDISRTHLRVTLDGWHVLVTDLNSTNGTLLTLPGHEPQQLRPGEPVPMQPGTVVTLAEGIDFRYEVAQ
jgi:FHA domain